ncbi:MAG: GNAT family N-acetyltransferase [Devosia sp.]
MADEAVFLRRPLLAAHPAPFPAWPDGFALFGLAEGEEEAIHTLLRAAYGEASTLLADPADWWGQVSTDAEFSQDLCLVVRDADRKPVGFAFCWTGGFINDIAVAQSVRGKGLGENLLRASLKALERVGAPHARLRCQAEPEDGPLRSAAARVGFAVE